MVLPGTIKDSKDPEQQPRGVIGTIRQLWWFFSEHKRMYLSAFLILLLSDALDIVTPWMIGHLTDQIQAGSLTRELFRIEMIVLVGCVILSYFTNYYWSSRIFKGSGLIQRDARVRLMGKFFAQSKVFYERQTRGSLLAKTMNDVESLEEFAGYGIMCLADATVYPMVLILVMGFQTSWLLTAISILPILTIIPISTWLSRILYRRYDAMQESYEALYNQTLENISGVRLIRAYRMEGESREKFRAAVRDTYGKTLATARLQTLIWPLTRIASTAALIISLLVGVRMIAQHQLTVGDVMSFSIYLTMLVWPTMAFGEMVNTSQQASSAMSRIQELLDYSEEVIDSPGADPYPGKETIEYRDLTFTYPTGSAPALEKISLTLEPGQTLGIVGKTGSGKTTLVEQLLGFYPVPEDSLYLGGREVHDWQLATVRNGIAYVPQDHYLFSETVADNVRFSREDAPDTEILEALEFASFRDDLEALPEGMETMVGERGVTLSGGQQQRLSLARAALKDADILILDDSLSAVDHRTEASIIRNINEGRKGRTTIITAHRLSAVREADEILVLDAGRIIQRGSHEELMDEPGWYRQQYLYQMEEGGGLDG